MRAQEPQEAGAEHRVEDDTIIVTTQELQSGTLQGAFSVGSSASHPFAAGYRKPAKHQHLILVLSVLAGCIVAGSYMWATSPPADMQDLPAQDVVRHGLPADDSTEFVGIVLLFGTIYATGMALYRYLGDAQGFQIVSATAGQHMPLLLLLGGWLLTSRHGAILRGESGRAVDWFMLATGLIFLAFSIQGLYRALVVHRKFYRWFYGPRRD